MNLRDTHATATSTGSFLWVWISTPRVSIPSRVRIAFFSACSCTSDRLFYPHAVAFFMVAQLRTTGPFLWLRISATDSFLWLRICVTPPGSPGHRPARPPALFYVREYPRTSRSVYFVFSKGATSKVQGGMLIQPNPWRCETL